MNSNELQVLLDRIYSLEVAYKGITTKLRLVEAQLDKLQTQINGSNTIQTIS